MPNTQPAVYLTPKDIGQMLKVSDQLIQKLLREGEMKGLKVGRYWRVSPQWLNEFLEGGGRLEQ